MIRPKVSPAPKAIPTGMNYNRAFGGGKKPPKFTQSRTVKGVRAGIRLVKAFKRNF